ncbi:MAG TPA: hypothetical protein VFE25_05665 [Opitutaceae bacterium]|nr:hypothetical protein [Opitutaceae bacterium]
MKRTSQKLLVVVGVLASVGAIAAGCGGGQDQSTRIIRAPQAPKTEIQNERRPDSFKDQANAMCAVIGRQKTAAIEEALAALAAEGSSGQKALEGVSSGVALPEVERMLRKLQTRQPPASEKAEFEKVIVLLGSGLRVAKKQPAEFLSGEAFEAADEALIAYGLNSCVV